MDSQKNEAFHYTEIPLEDARNAVLAGYGNYSEIKAALLEKLPKLSPDKAFAFGLPNGREVAERARRSICWACNSALKKAGIRWKVTYSGTKKLFVCIPRGAQPNPVKYSHKNEAEIKVLELRKQGLALKKIAPLVGLSFKQVQYLIYKKFKK